MNFLTRSNTSFHDSPPLGLYSLIETPNFYYNIMIPLHFSL